MAISQVPVAESWQAETFKQVGRLQPIMKREQGPDGRWATTGEQEKDKDGVPLWHVSVYVDDPEKDLDIAKVKIAAHDVPDDVVGAVPFFVGLRATYWSMARSDGNDASGLSLRADAVMKASDRARQAVGAPPKPSVPSKAAA
jgi:hypothetical protein